MPSALLPPLLAAIEPIAAYVARTPAGNRHADNCHTLIAATSDYVEAMEAEAETRAQQPDWQAIAEAAISRIETPGYHPTPLMLRVQQHLDTPGMKRRAALPLAQRMYLAQINSHYLGPPDYLTRDEPDTQN